MKAKLETITPQIAQEMMKKNENRKVTEENLQFLAKEMREGRWKINGDAIRVTDEGIIIDGQHRLLAVLRTGITIQSWVIYGLSKAVFNTIDVGKRRSNGDTLGCLGEKNACRMSAALILIDKYCTGAVEKSRSYSNSEIEGLLQKYPDVRKSLILSKSCKSLLLPSVMDSCHYLFSKKDTLLTEIFMSKVISGAGILQKDPAYLLRERLLANSMATLKLTKALMMALVIKAWNLTREGKTASRLQLNVVDGKMTSFPVII